MSTTPAIRTDEEFSALAASLGCSFRVATSLELFIDIDTLEGLKMFNGLYPIVHKELGGHLMSITPSKSGPPHSHIVVTLKDPLPLLARIALQAALGSDPKREILATIRALRGEENVVVFFEPISLRSSEHKLVEENL